MVTLAAPELNVRAPSKAWRILQGASPCRVRFNQPPVSSVAPVAENVSSNKTGEAYTENCAGCREFAASESWYSSETKLRSTRVLTCTEVKTEASINGKGVEGLRSHQAVACTKRYVQELGRPILVPARVGEEYFEEERH